MKKNITKVMILAIIAVALLQVSYASAKGNFDWIHIGTMQAHWRNIALQENMQNLVDELYRTCDELNLSYHQYQKDIRFTGYPVKTCNEKLVKKMKDAND